MSEQVTVPGRKFFPFVAGKTHGAHGEIVSMLQSLGQVEVDSFEESDYVLVFCPIASRVETDINEALSKARPDKPIILVVMHHTFDPERIVAESKRQVRNASVVLTVDVLFHEGRLLACNRNDISRHEIRQVLRDVKTVQSITAYAKEHPFKMLGIISLSIAVVVVIVVFSVTVC